MKVWGAHCIYFYMYINHKYINHMYVYDRHDIPSTIPPRVGVFFSAVASNSYSLPWKTLSILNPLKKFYKLGPEPSKWSEIVPINGRKWIGNWGEKKQLIGVITPLITPKSPPCSSDHEKLCTIYLEVTKKESIALGKMCLLSNIGYLGYLYWISGEYTLDQFWCGGLRLHKSQANKNDSLNSLFLSFPHTITRLFFYFNKKA